MKHNESQIIELYQSGISCSGIGAKINISYNTVKRVLMKNNIMIRHSTGLKKCNENYFENLDTPNKAYFLGFIYADGCILDHSCRRQNQLVINLQEQDKYILEKFKEELDFQGGIYFYDGAKMKPRIYKDMIVTRGNLYRLTVSSNKLCSDLGKLGVTPRKSLICRFPSDIHDDLMPHFIRGLMDGDGYISVRPGRKSYNTPSVLFGLTGTEDVCSGVRQILSDSLNFDIKKKLKKEDDKNVYVLNYTGNGRMRTLYRYLYPPEAELFLTRKRDKLAQSFPEFQSQSRA